MCSRVRQTQSPEMLNSGKNQESEQTQKNSNMIKNVKTLLRDGELFWSPGLSKSISDETTVDWRVKLEMEEEVRLMRVQSQTDSEFQTPDSANSPSGQSMDGNKKKNINNAALMTCVIPDFPPINGVGNVSQHIWPYQNQQVGSLHSMIVPSSRPVQMFYNYQPSIPTGNIHQHPKI